MRLLIHQVLKDLRMIRWLALAWLLLVAVFQAITVRMAHVPAGHDVASSVLVYSHSAIQGLLVALFAVIAVIVVQSDPAVGTTAFWFTRPISIPVLLAGKFVVTLVLLVVVPIGVDMIGMIAGGLSLGDALSTVPSSLATQIAWLLPLLALAAITTNLAQFVSATLAEILIFAGSVLAFRGLITRPRSYAGFADVPSIEVLLVVLVLGLVVFGFVSLVFAYRTRALRQAVTVAGIAPVALAAVLLAWPWSFASWRYERLSSPVTATVLPGSFRLTEATPGDWSLTGAFRFSNVPPRQVLSVRGVRAWIDYADGQLDLASGVALPATADPRAQGTEFHALSDAVGTPLTDPLPGQTSTAGFEAPVRKDVYERYRNQSGVFHADVRLIVGEKEIPAIVGARAGEHYRTAGRAGEILGVSAGPEALSLELRDVSIRPLVTVPAGETPSLVYAIRNPRLGLASLPSRSGASTNLPPYEVPIPVPAHLSTSWFTFDLPWPDNVSSGEWMRGAQVVIIESRTLGDAIVHVTIPDFMLSSFRDITRPMPR